jgi:hypothetical protein
MRPFDKASKNGYNYFMKLKIKSINGKSDEDKFNRMIEKIEKERKKWKVPLFIIGAGVSADRVPLMNEFFTYFEKLSDLPPKLRPDVKKLSNNKQYQSRAAASNFFGMLQASEDKEIKPIWDKFTENFLEGKIREGNPASPGGSLWDLEPTDFHKFVADQVVRDYLPAICVSLNYDGLTAKAIKRIANEKNLCTSNEVYDLLYPCRILTTAEEILKYYARNCQKNYFFPIIKLKGDIFNAICKTEGCRYQNQPIPIYEINQEPSRSDNKKISPDNSTTTLKYEEVMKCRGCGELRRVEIDFPGYRQKELETNKIVEMLYRFIVPSLSCIVVCGVSGKWDYEIVEFLRICALECRLKIYCLDKEAPPLLQYLTPWAKISRNDDESNFIPIKINFSEFVIEKGNNL